MKTVYGLFWNDDYMASTTWLDDIEAAQSEYDSLKDKGAQNLTLFTFEVEDDADEDEISDILDDFMLGRIHLFDLTNSTVLQ